MMTKNEQNFRFADDEEVRHHIQAAHRARSEVIGAHVEQVVAFARWIGHGVKAMVLAARRRAQA